MSRQGRRRPFISHGMKKMKGLLVTFAVIFGVIYYGVYLGVGAMAALEKGAEYQLAQTQLIERLR